MQGKIENNTQPPHNWTELLSSKKPSTQKESSILSVQQKAPLVFCNGSAYDGQWNGLGMQGIGEYTLFYGVEHLGYMVNGKFHGNGILYYPNGSRMEGTWKNGQMISHRYFLSDNLCYGPYCEMPDRRFFLEFTYGVKAAGRSFKTDALKERIIPYGCYDTGDGFYDPKKKCVYDPNDHTKILRIPTHSEHIWILGHCRKAWDAPVGYRPDLYETWKDKSFIKKFAKKKITLNNRTRE